MVLNHIFLYNFHTLDYCVTLNKRETHLFSIWFGCELAKVAPLIYIQSSHIKRPVGGLIWVGRIVPGAQIPDITSTMVGDVIGHDPAECTSCCIIPVANDGCGDVWKWRSVGLVDGSVRRRTASQTVNSDIILTTMVNCAINCAWGAVGGIGVVCGWLIYVLSAVYCS